MMPTDNRTLIMTRDNMDGSLDAAHIPYPTFTPSVSLRLYKKGDEAIWTRIWREAEPFDEIKDSTFHESLGTDEAVLERSVWFAVDEFGNDIGTVTAWSEPKDSESHPEYAGWGRVHWVAVVPAWQGRGVGKMLLWHCLNELLHHGHHQTFLVTSSGRIGAVAMYQKFGFVIAETGASSG